MRMALAGNIEGLLYNGTVHIKVHVFLRSWHNDRQHADVIMEMTNAPQHIAPHVMFVGFSRKTLACCHASSSGLSKRTFFQMLCYISQTALSFINKCSMNNWLCCMFATYSLIPLERFEKWFKNESTKNNGLVMSCAWTIILLGTSVHIVDLLHRTGYNGYGLLLVLL